MKPFTKVVLLAGVGSLLLACEETNTRSTSSTASSQQVASEEFKAFMSEAEALIQEYVPGISLLRDTSFMRLSTGQQARFGVKLGAGKTYALSASCDNCSNLDVILERNGVVIAEDTLPDDIPVAEAYIEQGGEYIIIVDMVECRESVCEAGLSYFVYPN